MFYVIKSGNTYFRKVQGLSNSDVKWENSTIFASKYSSSQIAKEDARKYGVYDCRIIECQEVSI